MAALPRTWFLCFLLSSIIEVVVYFHEFHTHKARTDKIRLLDVANEFVQRNENRFRNFGKFTDLDLSTC